MLAIPLSPQQGPSRGGSASSRGASRTAGEGEDARPLDPLPGAVETETVARSAAHEATPEERALAEQATAFNQTVRLQSEAEREMNALLALSMEQIKHDDEFLKKWIALI
jgi:hypothetical protein